MRMVINTHGVRSGVWRKYTRYLLPACTIEYKYLYTENILEHCLKRVLRVVQRTEMLLFQFCLFFLGYHK